ncbi:hypothetical protein L249_3697 [Ophiocordyceps polyrhachis-furcata BCC 54312]|uniref:Tr-type G domain-containing protein n=1 Tax=Ophiocordyceps polyrhachis-furcata BCC 54312 TaxID=1330021 RepID=A0A367L543_9HYPO|nr:hypothetical protein L249_3697 [Ophiocordyceps polyrhachis-furcata BCC 54312]
MANADGEVENTRNIGIIAHVDAGKTTTTERMLFYSGVTQRVGNVDAGNTVTDFLELERARGITIQSAAITFNWPLPQDCPPGAQPKTVNLIDTPGHQDFRFEVDRCLPVLDGAVCIIDSVKGVEAHTERVWASAQEFNIPRIVYCNKMDREGASFKRSILEIATRLRGWPLVCQLPWWEKENFVGVIDVIHEVGYRWKSDKIKTRYGPEELRELLSSANKNLLAEIQVARDRLVEGLAEFDDAIMNEFLAENPKIPASLLTQAIKRVISKGDGRLIPVFAGSSSRHIGIEPLMDAITDYLPSPSDRPDVEVQVDSSKHRLGEVLKGAGKKGNVASVASVFKVSNHPKEGVISFVRVYHGTLIRQSPTFNTNLGKSERPYGILQISASQTRDIQELCVGQIGALKGLRSARSGDTLLTMSSGKTAVDPIRRIQIRPPDIPPPVAFAQVNPFGKVAADLLQAALENKSREDPSLRWNRDIATDEFTIQGMGKLHLEISLHSMKQRKDIDAQYGDVEVDYKECVTGPTPSHHIVFDKALNGIPGKAACTVALEPIELLGQGRKESRNSIEKDGNMFQVEIPKPENGGPLPFHREDARMQLINGALAAVARGPRRGFPLQGCRVSIVLDTSEGAYDRPTAGHFSILGKMAVDTALKDALGKQQVAVLEPVMLAHFMCPEDAAGLVQHDITSVAGGQVLEIADRSSEPTDGDFVDTSRIYTPPDPWDAITSLRDKRAVNRVVEIVAKVPYKNMLDYDSRLRSTTAGRHTVTMSFDSFARVVGKRERDL